ncbi:MAG: mannitol dehydrogenase family protein [Pseudomonadota bacterium]
MTRRIVHLGVGNFHRAHQAWYTQQAGGWSITGVSLRSPRLRDQLAPQGFDYTLAIRDAAGEQLEQITVIDSILFAPEQSQAVLDAIASADLITLTITEKGYCLGPDGKLDLANPDIKSDLAGTPTSAIGYLTHGLAKRKTPGTVISCDNLNANGKALENAVKSFAQAAGFTLPDGLAFPCTMVDRITPATTQALSDHIAAHARPAAAPVETESFTEWVIEDHFAGPRPAWEKAGAQIVPDAAPYKLRKLRMLNGAHSLLAYAGLLKGHEFVHEAIADTALRKKVEGLFNEAAQTLSSAIETKDYAAALLTRFENPNLHHKLRQIAMDGTQKLPVRLLGTISDLNGDAPNAQASIAAWTQFAMSETAAGRTLEDPSADEIASACNSENPAKALKTLIGYPT